MTQKELFELSGLSREEFSDIYMGMATPELPGFADKYAAFTSASVIDKLYTISAMLIINAKKFNLTSITEPHEVVRKHIIDSIIPFGLILDNGISPRRTVDVGTGAGFPLLPMAAAHSELSPSSTFIGVDATGKKITHITSCAEVAGLNTVSAIQGRAEELSHGGLRERQDLCVARAVAELPVLVELCAGLVCAGGYFAALKSHADEEIEAAAPVARICGLELVNKINYEIPGGDFRSLIIYKKTKLTPDIYPRKYTDILKKALR